MRKYIIITEEQEDINKEKLLSVLKRISKKYRENIFTSDEFKDFEISGFMVFVKGSKGVLYNVQRELRNNNVYSRIVTNREIEKIHKMFNSLIVKTKVASFSNIEEAKNILLKVLDLIGRFYGTWGNEIWMNIMKNIKEISKKEELGEYFNWTDLNKHVIKKIKNILDEHNIEYEVEFKFT